MKITRQKQDKDSNQFMDWHTLVVAEAGPSMLDFYCRYKYKIENQIIRRFAFQVNRRDEPGSLHPFAPITAFPKRDFHEIEKSLIPGHIKRICSHLRDFLEANREHIHANNVLVDFLMPPQPIPEEYIIAIEEVFRTNENATEIEQVVIFI
jgi:hypothetical protein